ncbi:MAG: NAD(P)/FAD-dependent oxidoreductase [Rhodospirillaceae bacterium]
MTERVECVVVGAGVVGLAVARRLALAGREVVVLEAADAIGTGTSSRNSEVIHGGMYYPTGSLRARLCLAGNRALYDFCAARGIQHRRLGKLIVATDPAQLPRLEQIRRQGEINGVTDLRWLDAADAHALEPEVRCEAALLSPSTGIVDSHGLMLALQGEAEDHGAAFAFNSPALGGRITATGFEIAVGGTEPMRLACRQLVNCAGLGAQTLGRALEGLPPASVPRQVLAKGNYFAFSGRHPFRRLVYPIPPEASLGVHVVLDLAGQARFGPDVEWIDAIDYRVDPGRAANFYATIRQYWPGLPEGSLAPAFSGIRPKLTGPGEAAADFLIQDPGDHGIPGLVALYGIESPGLTSCLAIADEVAARLS